DFDRGYVKPNDLVFSTTPVAPRLGIAWDITNDGRTLLKAHYGRYYEGMKGDYYYWVDPNAYKPLTIRNIWQDGFVEDFPTRPKKYAIDSDIKQPYLDEYIVGLDPELFPGFTSSGPAIYRKTTDLLEPVDRRARFVPVK